jgi:DNA-binding NarL/FixJ family response regulator
MTTTNILLIDDHAMFRSGLRMVLNAHMVGAEVFEAASVSEAIQGAPEQIDVILLDIKLSGLSGLDGIELLKCKWPMVPVIVLSSQDGPETVRDALAHGAVRFISKADTADKIVALLNRVLRGEYNSPDNQPGSSDEASFIPPHLTPRQCEVLDLLCQGMSNKLIARQLALSDNTVRWHVQSILAFLAVSSREEAAFAARSRGLVG